MHRRFFLALVSLLFLLAATIAPTRAATQDIFVTPVPNAPFSAVVTVERSVVQRDGAVLNLKTIRDIHRDSHGRIYNESRALLPVSSTQTPEVERIHLYDPLTRTSTMLNPRARTFWTMTVNRPPATVPPSLINASPTGGTLPPNEFTRTEDLGILEMEGSPAHGVREIQTIPAENNGTGKEVVIVDEYWYADDLRINLMIKHSDPRTGTVKLTVGQLVRTEPDPALMEIPKGYSPARGEAEGSQ